MVGNYLVNLNLNKTICTYIITITVINNEIYKHSKIMKSMCNNIAFGAHKILCIKWSAQRGTQTSFYMCVIEHVVVSMFEFTAHI